jgi:hypothetical protein
MVSVMDRSSRRQARRRAARRRSLFGGLAAFAIVTLAIGALLPSLASADKVDSAANVTICHRTNSVTNPYEKITVAESSVNDPTSNSDHLSHLGPVFDRTASYPPPHNGDQWGDIVPPFDENGNARPDTTLTLNWPSGQAIFENGCVVPLLSSSTTTNILNSSNQVVTSVPVGTVVHDQATVTGSGATPTGTATFKFYPTIGCTGNPTTTESGVALVSGVASSSSSASLAIGSYGYLASYSGDDNYSSSVGACEPLTVTGLASATTTSILNASNVVVTTTAAGTVVHDQATVASSPSGGTTPTGTVSFSFYSTIDCSSTATDAGTNKTIVSGVATSNDSAALTAGSYSYKATYNGDSTYSSSVGACEPLTVTEVGGETTVSLNLSKALTTGTVPAGTTFTLGVVCTKNGSSLTVPGAPFTVTSPTLAVPTISWTILTTDVVSCTVTESTPPAGTSLVGYLVAGVFHATPTAFTLDNTTKTVAVVVQNVPTGSLQVGKVVSGPTGGAKTFTVVVDCNDGTSHDGTLTFNELGTLTSGTDPITGIPVGTQCSVTETGAGGALSTTYSVNGATPVTTAPTVTIGSTTQLVTITNTFVQTGGNITITLNVSKVVSGNGPVSNGTQFVVHVTCTGAASVNQDLVFTYPALTPLAITTQIDSLGSLSCTVTETGKGGATLVGYSVDGGANQVNPPTVVLDNGHTVRSVKVENDPTIQVLAATTLPFTGSDLLPLLYGALGLIGVGGVLLLLVGRRRPGNALE